MSGFEAGKAWGKSVNALARKELLHSGADNPSALKQALVKAAEHCPEKPETIRIRDLKIGDAAWIADFYEGVRSTRTKAEWQ